MADQCKPSIVPKSRAERVAQQIADSAEEDAIRESRIASPRVSAACDDRDLHAAEGRSGQLFSRASGCQHLIEPVVTYGYAVGHAGFQRCVTFGAGSLMHRKRLTIGIH